MFVLKPLEIHEGQIELTIGILIVNKKKLFVLCSSASTVNEIATQEIAKYKCGSCETVLSSFAEATPHCPNCGNHEVAQVETASEEVETVEATLVEDAAFTVECANHKGCGNNILMPMVEISNYVVDSNAENTEQTLASVHCTGCGCETVFDANPILAALAATEEGEVEVTEEAQLDEDQDPNTSADNVTVGSEETVSEVASDNEDTVEAEAEGDEAKEEASESEGVQGSSKEVAETTEEATEEATEEPETEEATETTEEVADVEVEEATETTEEAVEDATTSQSDTVEEANAMFDLALSQVALDVEELASKDKEDEDKDEDKLHGDDLKDEKEESESKSFEEMAESEKDMEYDEEDESEESSTQVEDLAQASIVEEETVQASTVEITPMNLNMLEVAMLRDVEEASVTFMQISESSMLCNIDNITVATLDISEDKRNADLFGTPTYTEMLTASFETDGLEDTLSNYGFEHVVASVEHAALSDYAKEKATLEETAHVAQETESFVEDFKQSVALASVALERGAISGKVHPLKAKLVADLKAAGLQNAEQYITAAFNDTFDATAAIVLEHASVLVGESVESRNSLSNILQSTRSVAVPCESEKDEVKDTVMASIVDPLSQSKPDTRTVERISASVSEQVQTEQPTSVVASAIKARGGLLFGKR